MSSFELDAIRAFPDEGPVTMINLVKYREQSLDGNGSGQEAYTRYTDVAQGLVEARGGKVLWAGVGLKSKDASGMASTVRTRSAFWPAQLFCKSAARLAPKVRDETALKATRVMRVRRNMILSWGRWARVREGQVRA